MTKTQAARLLGITSGAPKFRRGLAIIGPICLIFSLAFAETKPADKPVVISITKEEMPVDALFVGSIGDKVSNPHCIDYQALLLKTPECEEVKKKKLKKFDGKYWIYMSQARDRVRSIVEKYAKENHETFICDRSVLLVILKKLDDFKTMNDTQLIERFDLTGKITELMDKKHTKGKTRTPELNINEDLK